LNPAFSKRVLIWGKRLTHDSDLANLSQGTEAYLTSGMEDYFEPAIHVVHNDRNPSLLLKYVSHTTNFVNGGKEMKQLQKEH